ncbi:putative Glycosyltransferase, family 9 [Nitrospira sp. KM1]|uniref:glycosyltransferase family 9 protein n=1 Tax=Nitrospira sp. KM1 TaxID=1936990 RepID=UPI0013A736DB|nr:glycosyltransferase family 9 protein [Nitrospira sp. KM1]BCA54776.1 putative Glycosyltransferase, family 9 [Nitrospira sp. KM1]
MTRALVIQLARLGDLLQTIPVIVSIKDRHADLVLDLLCPAPFVAIARMIPGIRTVLGWDGATWRQQVESAETNFGAAHVAEADRHLRTVTCETYDRAYVLNQHPRALLAGGLLAREIVGARFHVLDDRLTPWAAYLRQMARTGHSHRVHLSDAFCGLCSVHPPGRACRIPVPDISLSSDLRKVGNDEGTWVGLLVGAGDAERLVPLSVWRDWIAGFLHVVPHGRVVLIGNKGEQQRAQELRELLPSSTLNRTLDLTGRTSLPELASALSRCHLVIGSDTGPLHLAAAVGTKVIGWYFSRASVHETGPYGPGHVIWQAVRAESNPAFPPSPVAPSRWPVEETLAYLTTSSYEGRPGWSAWRSHCDRWGAYYTEIGQETGPPQERERTWQLLHPVDVG